MAKSGDDADEDGYQPPPSREQRGRGKSGATRTRDTARRKPDESTRRKPDESTGATTKAGAAARTARAARSERQRPARAETTREDRPRAQRPPREETAREERPPREERAREERPPREARAREERPPREERARPQRVRRTGPPTRRRALLRRWMALFVFLGLVALTVLVLFTPVLGVRSVEVSGTKALTPAQIEAAAKVPVGTPMVRLDTGSIETRVATLPRVATVDVVREWPTTILIEVTERQAAAVFAGAGGVHLVDATGDDFATVATAPPGLPTLSVPHAASTDPTTQAVFAVLAAMPSQLRPELVTIGATTPGSVTFTLTTGKTIIWGDPEDSPQKATVLAALLSQPGKVYDVSAPDLPTISS